MSNRPVILSAFLAASAAIPYVWYHPTVQQTLTSLAGGGQTRGAAPGQGISNLHGFGPPAAMPLEGATTPTPDRLTGPDAQELAEVFRFDVDESWVVGRWARVTTTAGEYGLRGLRAPLVTGGGHDDLAGSITYYFDPRGVLRKIQFFGSTGDPRRLIALAGAHGLTPQYGETAGATRFGSAAGGPPGELTLKPAAVLAGNRPHERYELTFVLYRPAGAPEPAQPYVEDRRTYSFRP